MDNLGTKIGPFYHDDLGNWGSITSSTITFTPSAETTKFNIHLREMQVYQVMLPYQAILLK